MYSYTDLLALKTVQSLREDDISLQKVRRCVSYLRRNLPDVSRPLTICTLISAGESVYLVQDEETLVDTVKHPGQHAYRKFIDIAQLDRELRRTVLSLIKRRVETVEVGQYAYQVEIEPDTESGGYVATVAGLPGCITDGDTLDDVLEMAKDAIRCWEEAYQDLKQRGVQAPRGKAPRKKKRA